MSAYDGSRFDMIVLKGKKYFTLGLLLTGLLLQTHTLGQSRAVLKQENRARHRKLRHSSDSLWKKDFVITDTSAALVINRIEDINKTLNDINDILQNGYDTSEISENMPLYERSVKLIKYKISTLSDSHNINSLSQMSNRLDDITDDLKDWQTSLLSYYTTLVGMNTQMREMYQDSTINKLPADSSLRYLYQRQMKQLKSKWLSTDSITRKSLLKIDLLQTNVSDNYIEATSLQKKVRDLRRSYSKKVFSKEYGYLWDVPAKDSTMPGIGSVLERSVNGSPRILKYHFDSIWQQNLICLCIASFFFFWTFIKIKVLKREQAVSLDKLLYIRPVPILATLVFLFTFITFLDLHPPAIYMVLLQLLLIISITLLLARRWPKKVFFYWLLLAVLFVLYNIKSMMGATTYSFRILTFSLDIFSILLGLLFFREAKKDATIFPGYFQALPILYIILNLAAALSNLLGRITLSQVFGSTAISNLIQSISLLIFIQVVLEAVFIQLEADKKSKRFSAYLNYQNVELRLRRILTLIAGIFWFINLTQNLNIYDEAYDDIAEFLSVNRTVGSTSFTIGSILIFFFIVWLSNLLQKYIGYFFGDTNDEIVPDKKTRLGTSILLVRLLVLTAGFLFGVLASGIPLDKVTIIIGALGVGIGLGLQNIVNNLVSGVILAIERPIQVGDLIEIGGNTGRVKDIGIRSSRIVTAEGAEVIIPNGDMLSQKLTNWTLSNTHLRVEIDIKFGEGADLDKVKELISGLLKNNEDIMDQPLPQILFRSITQAGAELQVLFWAYDINKWVQLKSDMLQKIYQACKQENIPITG